MKNKAVVLLSGGLDSATTLAIAKNQGFEVYALSFDYGQRQRVELKKAKEIAKKLAVTDHQIMTIDLRQFGGSALTDSIDVPMNRDEEEMNKEIPITYVPARNTIFLSFCLAYAEVKTAQNIFLGVNAIDYSGYPDCRPEYYDQAKSSLHLGSKIGASYDIPFEIQTPIIELSKAEIVRMALTIEAPIEQTWSCYLGGDAPCGECDSCQLRAKGFEEANAIDPALSTGP